MISGFIAQEVAEVFPGMVQKNDDGSLGLAYAEFAVLAITAVQEQQVEIEALKAEIKAIKELLMM